MEGKTSIATQLALADARDGEKVVLIEADLRRPGIAASDGVAGGAVRSEMGLTNYLVSVGERGSDPRAASAVPEPARDLVGADPAEPDRRCCDPNGFGALIQLLRSRYDRIIIDTPPVSVGADASVIASRVDAVLYVIDATKTSPTSARAGLNQLEKVHASVAGVVVNRTSVPSFRGYYPPPSSLQVSRSAEPPGKSRRGPAYRFDMTVQDRLLGTWPVLAGVALAGLWPLTAYAFSPCCCPQPWCWRSRPRRSRAGRSTG